MSDSALSPAQAQLMRDLGPLAGTRIPGGCDRCDAYQTTEPLAAGVWKITVHHDPGCRALAAKTRPR